MKMDCFFFQCVQSVGMESTVLKDVGQTAKIVISPMEFVNLVVMMDGMGESVRTVRTCLMKFKMKHNIY